jgi:hypothetical protein
MPGALTGHLSLPAPFCVHLLFTLYLTLSLIHLVNIDTFCSRLRPASEDKRVNGQGKVPDEPGIGQGSQDQPFLTVRTT